MTPSPLDLPSSSSHPHLASPLICFLERPSRCMGLFHLALNRTTTMIRNSLLVFAALLLAAVYGEQIKFNECPKSDPNAVSYCTVHSVDVQPCKEAAEGKPCRLKRGNDASISFNYTANFEGQQLESRAYWASEVIDLPFIGMETNACLSTVCPAVPGQQQVYTIQLPISRQFPVRAYDLKWKLWNEQKQECCFMFAIKLHK
ncbi:MD-2-related lipid-recognition protein-like [Prorops nasuta]|uniref:MD-2-related lipid-recognition protein-like n=1 Tax=Prorops nasuta TaxID=863751 RepID=UPI0034CD10BD